jgi:hypothetical protein
MVSLRILIAFIVFLFVSSCKSNNEFSSNNVPNDLLNEDEFTIILSDVILLEASANHQSPNLLHTQKVMKLSNSEILKKHHISNKQFEVAYTYYAGDKEKMDEIYSKILEEYNIQLSKIK